MSHKIFLINLYFVMCIICYTYIPTRQRRPCKLDFVYEIAYISLESTDIVGASTACFHQRCQRLQAFKMVAKPLLKRNTASEPSFTRCARAAAAGLPASQHRVLSHRRFAEKSTVITCHITGGLPLTASPELPSDSDLICSK